MIVHFTKSEKDLMSYICSEIIKNRRRPNSVNLRDSVVRQLAPEAFNHLAQISFLLDEFDEIAIEFIKK